MYGVYQLPLPRVGNLTASRLEKVANYGFTAEVWLEKDSTGEQVAPSKHEGGLCLVLGAGNFEAPTDILDRMYVGCELTGANCQQQVCSQPSGGFQVPSPERCCHFTVY